MYENSYKETRGALKTGFGEESVYAVKADFGEEGLNALKGADLETTYRYRYIEESQKSQNQENKSYIYKDGNLVALTAGTSNAYYSSDIHGSTRQVSDTSGFSESYNYDSFGKPIYKSTYVDYEEGYDLDAVFGENTDWQQIDTENTSKNNYRFSSWYQTRTTNVSPYASLYHDYLSVAGYSGKSYNSNTGLNNYGFRDYSSSIGRFITSDPIRDGTNWYTLAVNNPINFVDLWGLAEIIAGDFIQLPNGVISDTKFGHVNVRPTDVTVTYTKNSNNKLYVTVRTLNDDGTVDYSAGVKTIAFDATNIVKTPEERNNIPVSFNGYNYFPEQFPSGKWDLYCSETSENPLIGPKKIGTNAYADVSTYSKVDGEWVKDEETQRDEGYLIHSGTGSTTWGCIKMSDRDVRTLARIIDSALTHGGTASLKVI